MKHRYLLVGTTAVALGLALLAADLSRSPMPPGPRAAASAALAAARAASAAPSTPVAVAVVAPHARMPERKPDGVRVLIAAEEEGVLAAQMAGRIASIGAKLGERVKQGQPIVRFDCDEQQARVNMAHAEWGGAQQLHDTKTRLQAMQSASLLEVSQAVADVQKAKAQLELYQAQLRLCSVNAPFSGRVTKLRVRAFESVVVGQQLVEVVNDERSKVQLSIPSAWLGRVNVNHAFQVRIDETGKAYEARVRRINAKVDAVSQSVEIEGDLPGSPKDLLPGMSGVAVFPGLASE